MSQKMKNIFVRNSNEFGTSSIQSGFVLKFLDENLGKSTSLLYEDDLEETSNKDVKEKSVIERL